MRVAAVQVAGGTASVNTRWRDFADVYLLSASHGADGDELAAPWTPCRNTGAT
jgi:hypothetical protein